MEILKWIAYLFLALAVVLALVGMITPVSIGWCMIGAVILAAAGLVIEVKRKEMF